MCKKHHVNPQKIIVEITETSEILDLNKANLFIKNLKKLGITVALDDFGDGFATLRYLRSLSFDLVKIDGQFVINIDKNIKDQIIVDSLIDSARKLGMKIVVECVETSVAHEFFKKRKVDYLQGFYYSSPISFDELLLECELIKT